MLKLQYFGHLMGTGDSLDRSLMEAEGKGVTEDEMAGWHHQCNERELGQTPRDGGGHGTLVCCSPCSRKELDTTEWLNNNNNN